MIIGIGSQQSLDLQRFNTVSESWRVYAEQDADGNVISISDSSGNVLERYAYDDYGNVTVLNADGSVRGDGTAASSLYGWVYLHQGLRYDPVTGLYYDRFRQTYDPTLGRFLQPDPTGPAGSGVDLYQFASGNPISNEDPSGLQTEPSAEQEPGQEGYGGGQGGGGSGEAVPPLGLTGSFNPQTMAEDRLMEQHGDLSPGEASSYERELAADAQYEQQQAALAEQQAQAEAQAEKQAVDSQAQQDEAEDDANLSQAQKDKIAAAKAARACPTAARGAPKPSPKFQTPTNPPQLPPQNVPDGWRVRQMPPTEQYPNGYWRLEKPMTNGGWQGIDPSTMKPGTQPQTHVPFPPPSGGQ